MKIILKQEDKYFIRFDTDEEVIGMLKDFCKDAQIESAHFFVIGAIKEVVLSFYNFETKQYEDKPVKEDLEITSLSGNVAWMNDDIIVHGHGSFSDNKMNVMGGHVKKMVASGTCELILSPMKGKIKRGYDEKTGLNLTQ